MRKHSTIIVLLLFATAYAFANWTGSISEPELRTKIEGKSFFLIATPEELAWFAAQVNSGNTEINAQLVNDIVLWEDSLTSSSKAISWKPIGDSLTKSFNGIFDGNNYTIRGLYIHEERKIYSASRTDSICIGLFGSLGHNGIVKNLEIENAYFDIGFTTPNTSNDELLSKNSANIGGVIGFNEGSVEKVSLKGTFETGGNLGGLIGRNNGSVENVAFEGCVGSGYGKIGGIIGSNSGSIKKAIASGKIQSKISATSSYESYIGGIAGYVENGLVIEDCENNVDIAADSTRSIWIQGTGYVNASAFTHVGGIAGKVIETTSIINCINNGSLQAYHVGGIAGEVIETTSIINCINNGSLQAYLVGGIAGTVNSTIIDNCKNEGAVFGRAAYGTNSSGGIIGKGKSVQITNCSNNAPVSGAYYGAAGIAGSFDSNSIIDNCVNNGVVKAVKAAGFVATGSGLIRNCINNDSIMVVESFGGSASGIGDARVIENCINNGSVIGGNSAAGIGSANLIENCTNNGNVISKYEYFGTNYNHCGSSECYCPEINISNEASGIGRGTNIKNCTNNGNVTAYVQYTPLELKNVAAICDDDIDVFAGGISASASNSNISKSINKGHVNAYSEMLQKAKKAYSMTSCASHIYAGGIVGYASGRIKIVDNYSLADVYATNHLTINPQSCNNGTWLGGVAGLVKGDSATFIQNVYSVADSVIGYASGGEKIYTYYGALFGQTYREKKEMVQINNVYYDSKIKNLSIPIADAGSTDTINVRGLSTSAMQSDQFAWVLNTTAGTQDHSKLWSRKDGYPIFADDENLPIYKVTFDDDGATNFYRYTYECSNNKGQVSIPQNQTPAGGYRFVSWVKENGDVFDGKQPISEDITVSALYTPVAWTINFYNAAPADTLLESKSYQQGSLVTYSGTEPTLASTAKYTYTFKGWDVEPTNAVEDFDYHAIYDSTIRSYTIMFKNFDGELIENATVEYGKMPSCSKIPTRAATVEWQYTYKGWKPALDYVTEEASYTAIYDSSKVEYKVTFMNGTDVIDEQMVPYGDAAIAPTNVTRKGHKFVGWDTSFSKITENLTVKALFEELTYYTVNVVDENGEKIDEQKVEDGEKYKLPEATKKDGYTFDGWYKVEDGFVGNPGDEITITGNLVVKAQYTVISYTITFVDEDGSEISSAKVAYGTLPMAPEDPTKASTAQYTYVFAGWDKEITKVTGSTTYTATYNSSVRSYTIIFADEDGTEISSAKVAYGTLPMAPEDPTKASSAQYTYTFAGWDKEITKVTGSTTYTATYNSSVRSYTIIFADEDGTEISSAKVAYGTLPMAPEDPTKASSAQYKYTFAGWDKEIANVTGAVIYTATYNKFVRNYTVTFLDFDGSVLDEQSVAYGNFAESPENPIRKGYKFIGWDTDYSYIVKAIDVTALYEKLSSSSSAMVSSSSTVKSSSSKNDISSSSAKSFSSEKEQNVFVANNIPVFNVFVVERNVQIVNAKVGSMLIVFDMQGRIILTQTVNAVNFAISLPQAGRYIIRVDQAYKVVHVK